MSLTILVSIIIRIIAMNWSLFLLWRLRDWRMGFFSLMLSMMAARQILTLISIGLDKKISIVSNLDEIPALLVSLLALVAIFFLNRIFSEHLQSEQKLNRSEKMLQMVLDAIPVRVFWKDQQLKYLGCNRHFVKDARLQSASEIVGKDDDDLSWSEQEQSDDSIDQQIINSGKSKRNYEAKYKRSDGDPGWLRMNKIPMLDKKENIIGILGCYEDITDQKQAEVALRVRDRAINASVDGVVITDAQQPDNPIIYVNPAFEQITGYSASEVLGRNCRFLQGDDIEQPGIENIRIAAEEKRPVQTALRNYRKDGSLFWNDLHITPVRAETGEITHFVGIQNDITEQKNIEIALEKSHELVEQRVIDRTVELQASEERYRDLFENAHDLIQSVHVDGTFEYVNRAWREALGYTEDELAKLTVFDIVHPECLSHCQTLFERIMTGEIIGKIETRFITKDGQILFVEGSSSCRSESGKPVATRSIFHNVTARKQAEATLFSVQERARVTLASIADAVITTDTNGTIDYLNPVAETLTGWSLNEARGQSLESIFHIIDEQSRKNAPDPVTRCMSEGKDIGLANHTALINRDGKENAIENSAAPIRDDLGKLLGAVLVFRDVSEQRRLAKEITYQASHDALTGLVNRQEFESRVQHVLQSVTCSDTKHALCFMDLDKFKIVNDSCGHAAGDELLRQVSKLFDTKVRHRDTLGRLGGDEFGVLLEHCSLDQAKRVADEMRLAIEEFRFTWECKNFRIGTCIGLVPIDKTSLSVEAVMNAADSACYVAKENGRNRVHIYRHDDVDLAIRHRETQWVTRIQNALDNNRFLLHAQPIIAITKSSNVGSHYELLLRLRDEHDRLILPGVFMPAAERYQLAVQLDRWVITRAFSWLAENPEHLKQLDQCAINLSGQSVCDHDFEDFLFQQFDETGLPGEKICFEITETAAISNLSEATRFINSLKTKGCRFALDDFGSGLSSFAYLKKLPVDFLKIDSLFVKDITSDPLDLAMVRSINEIGQLMGKQTIAEGVENKKTFDTLQKLRVDFVQGYKVGLPCPLIEMLSPALKHSKSPVLEQHNSNVLHYHFKPTTNP